MTITSSEASPATEIQEPIDGAPAPVEGTDANPAASSTVDEGAKEPGSLLDVVKSAVEPAPEAAASPAVEEGQEPPAANEGADPNKVEAEGADDANLPFHTHPRWKEMVAQRDQFRGEAEQYGKITGFMQEHGLSPQEVGEGFEIMALLKSGDPTKLATAREWFSTRLQALDGHLGNVLPDDLHQRVEDGLLDEDGARELAQARAAAKLRAEQERTRTERDGQVRATEEAQAAAGKMAQAVQGWEDRIKASDPDYSKKAKLVETTCHAIVQRTGRRPTNEAEAIKLVEEAYAEVGETLKGMIPPKRQVTPTPRSSSTPTVAEPKTLREAIAAGLAKAAG